MGDKSLLQTEDSAGAAGQAGRVSEETWVAELGQGQGPSCPATTSLSSLRKLISRVFLLGFVFQPGFLSG